MNELRLEIEELEERIAPNAPGLTTAAGVAPDVPPPPGPGNIAAVPGLSGGAVGGNWFGQAGGL